MKRDDAVASVHQDRRDCGPRPVRVLEWVRWVTLHHRIRHRARGGRVVLPRAEPRPLRTARSDGSA
jgi:hypothetical protein